MMSLPSPPPTCKQTERCDEQRSTDDGPDDGKGLSADTQREEFRKSEHICQSLSDERSNESQNNRHQAAATGNSRDGLPKRPTNSGHQEQQEKFTDGHSRLVSGLR